VEDEGPNLSTGKYRTKNAGPENAGPENAGPIFMIKTQDWKMQDP